MDEALRRHKPFVKRIARRLAKNLPRSIEVDDLVQVGMISLLGVIERFDPTKDSCFETFATPRVRGAMIDELRRYDVLSRDQRGYCQSVRRATERLQAEFGRTPFDSEVANYLGVSLDEFHRFPRDVAIDFEQDITELGMEPDGLHDPFAFFSAKQQWETIVAAVDKLSATERYVMDMVYDQDVSMIDISKALRVTESRVSQIRKTAVKRLARLVRRI